MIYKKALICKTKNLFSTSTAVGTLSGFSNTTPRQFEEGKWYIGLTSNNYYSPNEIVEYEFTENYAYVKNKGSGYGIGKAFKCEPNQTYTVSCKWIKNTNYIKIATGFFDENGNYLSHINAQDLAEKHTFTTPANCKWFTVCFVGTTGSTYVYNIQLEKGSTPTDFVPNGYLQSYKKAIKVSDVCQLLDKSKFPATYVNKGVTYTNNGDGTVTVNGTSTDTYYSDYQIPIDVKRYIPGHKYALLSTGIQTDVGTINCTSQVIIADFLPGKYYFRGPNSIAEFPEYEGTVRSFRWEIRVNKGITVTNLVCKPQLFDLTEMYGAGNEPTTVAEFRQKFPNDLYPYRPYCFVDSLKNTIKVSDVCQLFDKSRYPATVTRDGITFTNNGNGTITVNGTNTGSKDNKYTLQTVNMIGGHQYYINSGSGQAGAWDTILLTINSSGSSYHRDGNLFTQPTSLTNTIVYFYVGENVVIDNVTFKPQLFDLTEMYGAGNEPTTVEEFRQKFPNDYYAYKPYSFI